ncbi:MAG: YerC/YecD family TrpR-related protein [Alphaproteobacteria bacterium]|nr:YerC/YecD family TrpR-related protein [Alphaproteobacteria bacterium]
MPIRKKSPQEQRDFNALCDALLEIKDREECRRFLVDLCTPAEIKALAERWRVARMLHEGVKSYREIHAMLGVSVTTIGRVARFLMQEPHQGYLTILKRIETKSHGKS